MLKQKCKHFYIKQILVKAITFAITFYQKAISPWFPPVCRFHPSCSEYSKTAYQTLGFWKGSYYTFKRLLCCHPFYKGNLNNPVPKQKDL